MSWTNEQLSLEICCDINCLSASMNGVKYFSPEEDATLLKISIYDNAA